MKQASAIKHSKLTRDNLRRAFIFNVPDRNICYWSLGMFEILGVEPVGTPDLNLLFDMIHDNDRVQVMDIYYITTEETSSEYVVEFRLKNDQSGRKLNLYVQQEEFNGDTAILLQFKPDLETQVDVMPGGEIAKELKKDHLAEFFNDIGYWEYHTELDLYMWSSQIYQLLGVDKKKRISYKDFAKSAFPEDLIVFKKAMRELSPEKPNFNFQTRHIANGELMYAMSRGTSSWNGNRLVRLMGSFENITREQVTKGRLEHVEKIAQVGWYEINLKDKKNSSVSKEYLKMHGLEIDRMPSLNELLACIHPEDHERIIASRKQLYEDFVGWLPFEYRAVLKDGSIRYFESSGQVLSSPIDNKPYKIVAVTKDITALKEKELQLRHANELAQLGWYEFDMNFENLYVSDEFLSILEMEEYNQSILWAKVHPEDLPVLERISNEFTTYEHGYSFQFRITLESGDYRFIQNNGRYEHDPVTGELVKVLGTVQDITDFKSLEDRLQRAQKISQTGWFEYDIINPIASSFSQEWLDMHDFDHQPTRLTAFLDKIHPVDRQMIPNLQEFLKRMPDEWYNLDYRIITRYGHKRYISNSARLLYRDGQPSKIFGTTIDVTKSRVTERALKESERKYRLMSENSRDAILLLEGRDKGMVITFASDYVEELTGYSKYRLLGMEATQLMHKEDRVRFSRDILPKLLFAKESTTVTFRLFREDGEYLWVETNIGVLIEETPVKLQLSVRDISDRKAFEEQLVKTNTDLQAMIKATEDIVFIIKKDLTFEKVIVNDERKLHIPSADFIDQPINQLWADDNGLIMCGMVEEAFKSGKTGKFDYSYSLRGVFDWYRAHVQVFQGYDNEDRVSVMIEKITTQKRAEEELRKTMEMERELSKMRASFVSMASHQFRTPLTVIKSNMQLLELSGKNDPLTIKVSARLTREVDRMVGLMEDILMLGKVQSGAIKPRFAEISLYELVTNIKSDIDVTQKDGRVLIVKVKGEERHVILDEGLIRQAVLNLVTNAFKYSEGQPNPVLTIDYTNDNHVSLNVRDFGLGISKDNISRIFKDFYRSDRVSHIPGTGLGLSVTSEFLKINNCTISVESEEGNGSCFTVTIPNNNDREEE